MDIKVLGTLAVTEAGTSITPVTAESRQVLALLSALAGRIVPIEVLVEEVWPDEQPRQARLMLQSYVNQLRSLLAAAPERGSGSTKRGRPGSREPLALTDLPGGYRLNDSAGTNDAWQFQRAAGAGYRAMATGDLRTATVRLREALELWRGEAFADVVTGPHLTSHIARLHQSRDRALGQWIEAELRLGRHRQVTADLTTLHLPAHLRDQLIALLHECDDPDQATTAYHRFRRQLRPDSPTSLKTRAPVHEPRLHRCPSCESHTALSGPSVVSTSAAASSPWRSEAALAGAPA